MIRLADGSIIDERTNERYVEETVLRKEYETIAIVDMRTVKPSRFKRIAVKKKNQVNISKVIDVADDKAEWKPNGSFIKLFTEFLRPLAKIINGAEVTILLSIMQNIKYGSGLIAGYKDNALSNNDIAKITGISKAKVSKTMTNLVNKRIVDREKDSKEYKYFANPYLFLKGEVANADLLKRFEGCEKYFDGDSC